MISAMEGSFSFMEVGLQFNMEDEHFSRKPYHRYCKCGFHSLESKTHHHYNCPSLTKRNVGFPLRRVWSESNLSLHTSSSEPSSSPTSATKLCHPPKPKMVKSNSALHLCE
ncbi:hypothetical protein SUGI_0891520 [Cryptomeria japonica]|nr:hypothetical protein SUGI_0891520 [Cryptomeria japonica]